MDFDNSDIPEYEFAGDYPDQADGGLIHIDSEYTIFDSIPRDPNDDYNDIITRNRNTINQARADDGDL